MKFVYLLVWYILGGIQVFFLQKANSWWNTLWRFSFSMTELRGRHCLFLFFCLSCDSGTTRIPKSRMDSSGTKFLFLIFEWTSLKLTKVGTIYRLRGRVKTRSRPELFRNINFWLGILLAIFFQQETFACLNLLIKRTNLEDLFSLRN